MVTGGSVDGGRPAVEGVAVVEGVVVGSDERHAANIAVLAAPAMNRRRGMKPAASDERCATMTQSHTITVAAGHRDRVRGRDGPGPDR